MVASEANPGNFAPAAAGCMPPRGIRFAEARIASLPHVPCHLGKASDIFFQASHSKRASTSANLSASKSTGKVTSCNFLPGLPKLCSCMVACVSNSFCFTFGCIFPLFMFHHKEASWNSCKERRTLPQPSHNCSNGDNSFLQSWKTRSRQGAVTPSTCLRLPTTDHLQEELDPVFPRNNHLFSVQ